jgi:hypothetical protein
MDGVQVRYLRTQEKWRLYWTLESASDTSDIMVARYSCSTSLCKCVAAISATCRVQVTSLFDLEGERATPWT